MKGFTFSADPSPEVSAYLKEKGDRPAFRSSEVWGEEHAYAFTVAKATSADVLTAIRSSLQTAKDKGVPYEAWARELKPELQRLGWWGVQDVTNPATGERELAELGSPRRLGIIYRSNMRSARAAGQYERSQRTKAVLPFWLYGLGPSVNHRPEHVAKEGTVLPVDHPFWSTWFPPNGWECKCWVRQITRAEAMRRGVTPDFDVPMKTFRRVRDDGSFERVQVPEGIDPGWQTNPGLNRARTLMTNMADRLIATGEPAARALMADFWTGSTPEAVARLGGDFAAPVAVSPSRLREDAGSEALLVSIDGARLRANLDREDPRPLKAEDFGRVQAVLDVGVAARDGARLTYVLDRDGERFEAEVQRTADGALTLVSLRVVPSA